MQSLSLVDREEVEEESQAEGADSVGVLDALLGPSEDSLFLPQQQVTVHLIHSVGHV